MKKSKIIKSLQAELEMLEAVNKALNTIYLQTEQHLQSAEKALDYKEKVIEKYKKLLSVSVENL